MHRNWGTHRVLDNQDKRTCSDTKMSTYKYKTYVFPPWEWKLNPIWRSAVKVFEFLLDFTRGIQPWSNCLEFCLYIQVSWNIRKPTDGEYFRRNVRERTGKIHWAQEMDSKCPTIFRTTLFSSYSFLILCLCLLGLSWDFLCLSSKKHVTIKGMYDITQLSLNYEILKYVAS